MNSPTPGKAAGIFYGWWIVAASFVMFVFCGGTYYYGFTAFFNPMVDEFGWSYAATSLAFSLRSVETSFLAPLIGFSIDKFGPRKIILLGVVVLAGGLMLMSRTGAIWLFYVTFLIASLGATAGFGIAQYTSVANWFVRRRALAMGILSAGYGICGTLAPLMVFLIALYGWRASLVLISIATLAVCIPLSLVIRHRPEQYGYLPDGDSPGVSLSGDAGLPAGTGQELSAADEEGDEEPADFSTREALKTRAFWQITLFSLFTGFAQSSMGAHEMPHLTSVGISREIAALTMTGITLCSLIGRLGFPALSSWVSKKRLLATSAVLQFVGVFLFAFATVRASWLIVPFLLTYGPGFGGPIPLIPALQADYFGLKAFASIQGLLWIGWMVAGIAGPLLAGWMFDVSGTYRLAWIIMAALSAGGTVVALTLAPPARKMDSRPSRLEGM